jgi:hypothetical protein
VAGGGGGGGAQEGAALSEERAGGPPAPGGCGGGGARHAPACAAAHCCGARPSGAGAPARPLLARLAAAMRPGPTRAPACGLRGPIGAGIQGGCPYLVFTGCGSPPVSIILGRPQKSIGRVACGGLAAQRTGWRATGGGLRGKGGAQRSIWRSRMAGRRAADGCGASAGAARRVSAAAVSLTKLRSRGPPRPARPTPCAPGAPGHDAYGGQSALQWWGRARAVVLRSAARGVGGEGWWRAGGGAQSAGRRAARRPGDAAARPICARRARFGRVDGWKRAGKSTGRRARGAHQGVRAGGENGGGRARGGASAGPGARSAAPHAPRAHARARAHLAFERHQRRLQRRKVAPLLGRLNLGRRPHLGWERGGGSRHSLGAALRFD